LYPIYQLKADKNDMKQKNISYQSNNLLSYFLDSNQPCFTNMEAEKALPDVSEGAVRELLSDMVRRGLLMRVKQGLYYIIPFDQDPEIFMPDWHLLAEKLANGNKHYIGYYSALQVHQLITQPSLKELIVVDHQIKPAFIKIKEIIFQFIYHNEKHFFGAKQIWIDSFNKVSCSDLEKTFVDCLFKPGYAGGIVEIGKALFMAKEKIDYEKLFDYCVKFGSQAVIKRLGFLLETYDLGKPIVEKLQSIKTDTYIPLDTEITETGKSISRWRIRQNIDTETLQQALLT
jgi:predicted transcriptional regulator of viral defense system